MAGLLQGFLVLLFVGLARLPLLGWHVVGRGLGWLAYRLDAGYARRLRDNLAGSGLAKNPGDYSRLLRQSIGEHGKGLLELIVAWGRPPQAVSRLVRACHGWPHVAAAQAAGKPLLFVSPHLGCYDIAGRYLSSQLADGLMAMYRPPKMAWLEPLMNAGRVRGKSKTAPATAAGVRIFFKHLKQGGAAFILPDQAPGAGEGVWAPFFGRPAYTMTLLPRLAASADAVVLFCFARRLSWGRGYELVIEPLADAFTGDKLADATRLNQAIERLIAQAPSQYLWSYNRYKQPAGAPAAEEGA